jgi:hypothetical protein
MKPLLALTLFFSFVLIAQDSQAQLFKDRPVGVGINWSEACALSSVAAYAECRNRGGSKFACLSSAGLHYWMCSGSSFQTSFRRANKVRSAMVGRRVLRRSK